MPNGRTPESGLLDVPVRVDVVLGEARIPIERLMNMSGGEIVALEKSTTEPVDIYVSDRLMARGRLIVSNGQLGVKLSEIIDEKQTEVVQTRKLVQSIKSLAPKEEPEEVEEPEIVEPEPKPKVYRGKRGRPSKMDLRLSGELDE